jgi:protein transport protein SEC24
VSITPYPKSLQGKDDVVPIANSSNSNYIIVRCKRCRSYLNPYVEIIDQGTRWKCNLCFVANEFPPNFDFDPVKECYVDRGEKVELRYPVYEFLAPAEYMVRPPQAPAYLFVIDVSWCSVSIGKFELIYF